MKLIERYLLEVGTYLPKDLHDDVTEELRSNLSQAMEDRRLADPSGLQEDLEVAVLKELGHPIRSPTGTYPDPGFSSGHASIRPSFGR